MYSQNENDVTAPAVREIYLPSIAFQLLVGASSVDGSWVYRASGNQETPAHLEGKRVLTLLGVRYVEE